MDSYTVCAVKITAFMTRYELVQIQLCQSPKTWLVTGVAGFIGSNLLETLLKMGQRVVGLDNFATGHQGNLDKVQKLVTIDQWANFRFMRGDIRKLSDCQAAMTWTAAPDEAPSPSFVGGRPYSQFPEIIPVDHVLHQAALGSVPRSVADPIATNDTNITGFLNMLVASRDAQVQSFTYAASSSTYGDHPTLPKVEANIGNPLSPYAVSKFVNELYAGVFARNYCFKSIGLRYFNVFGPRQDPNGVYAAVIPKWASSLLKGEPVYINGDGETSRDFCYVANAVQANLLAACSAEENKDQVYNVAVGDRTTLNSLFEALCNALQSYGIEPAIQPNYRGFREGDVQHSQADIKKIQKLLGYAPTHDFAQGLIESIPSYLER